MRTFERRFAVGLRLGLGALFLYAAVAKFGLPRVFTADIVRLQLVPFSWAEWVAASVTMAELLTGAWLVSGWRRRAAALAVMVLAVTFAVAVAQAMVRGLDFNCHCFGLTDESPSAGWVLARALALGAAAGLLRWLARPSAPEPGSPGVETIPIEPQSESEKVGAGR